MVDTGLETGMQLVQDVINGQPLKKAAKTRAQAAGKNYSQGLLMTLHSKVEEEENISPRIRQSRAVEDRPRKGEHLVQRSALFLIKDCISTPSLSPGCEFKFTVVWCQQQMGRLRTVSNGDLSHRVFHQTIGWLHSGQWRPPFHHQTVYHQDQRNAGNGTVRHSSIQCIHQDLIEL